MLSISNLRFIIPPYSFFFPPSLSQSFLLSYLSSSLSLSQTLAESPPILCISSTFLLYLASDPSTASIKPRVHRVASRKRVLMGPSFPFQALLLVISFSSLPSRPSLSTSLPTNFSLELRKKRVRGGKRTGREARRGSGAAAIGLKLP